MPGTSNEAAVQNGHVNGDVDAESEGPLKILIAGAGIAGLSAAIGLRKQGYLVTIFETSQFNEEVGAAVHIAPNANGVLKRLGVDVAAAGANKFERLTEYDSTGELRRSIDLSESNKIWQHEWLLAHRAQLHESLKRAALTADGEGAPAKLLLGSKVVQVDPVKASVTLEDGSVVSGDVVIGADGVHSKSRKAVPGCDHSAHGSGKSAFRFMIPAETARANPLVAKLLQHDGELIIWYHQDRRVVVYPTSHNTLLNFVCIHPEHESDAGESWTTDASQDRLRKVYEGFPEECLALISMADPATVKSWKLLDMQVLPTFVHERLALMGDAAHPFLPHQGQGAGVSIEDAVSLSVFLERGLNRKDVPDRIKLYQETRYERANKIQEYSRLAGRDLVPGEAATFDMVEYTNYNLGHDEFDNSIQRLREWKWGRQKNIYWRMPIAFGPMPGPRQSHAGVPREATQSTFRTASIKFKTSRTNLQNLFPPGIKNIHFTSPGTVAYASFACTTLDKMEWLGNTGYTHIGLYIHGVEYEKQDGSKVSGTYMPILFESLTDPIVSGREELGMPKLYTEIDTHQGASSFRIQTSWKGSMWGNFRLTGLEEDANSKAVTTGKISGGDDDDDGIIVFRYMPQVGTEFKGVAETTYPVFVPFAEDLPKPQTRRVWKASGAKIDIDGMDWEALPTLHHIVSRLADIPIHEIVSAKVVEGEGVPDVSQARRIEQI